MTIQDRLRTTGVWYFTNAMSVADAATTAARIESLGYSTLWLPDTTGRDPFAHIAYLAEHTETLVFATGIANIFHRHPGAMMQVANTLAEQTGGRFVLGLGVSHAPLVSGLRGLDYSKPLSQMRAYLAGMDASPYSSPVPRRPGASAARGPGPEDAGARRDRRRRSPPLLDDAEPHRRGPGDPRSRQAAVRRAEDRAQHRRRQGPRRRHRPALGMYSSLPNYRNNWLRLGFSDDEIESGADHFVDALVPWGTVDDVQSRIRAHYEAGADHVCIQPLSVEGPGVLDWKALEALAPGA